MKSDKMCEFLYFFRLIVLSKETFIRIKLIKMKYTIVLLHREQMCEMMVIPMGKNKYFVEKVVTFQLPRRNSTKWKKSIEIKKSAQLFNSIFKMHTLYFSNIKFKLDKFKANKNNLAEIALISFEKCSTSISLTANTIMIQWQFLDLIDFRWCHLQLQVFAVYFYQ